MLSGARRGEDRLGADALDGRSGLGIAPAGGQERGNEVGALTAQDRDERVGRVRSLNGDTAVSAEAEIAEPGRDGHRGGIELRPGQATRCAVGPQGPVRRIMDSHRIGCAMGVVHYQLVEADAAGTRSRGGQKHHGGGFLR